MGNVVGCQKFEGNGIIVADMTGGLELRLRQVRDNVGEKAVVGAPEREKLRPGGLLKGLYLNVAVLVITGKGERLLQAGAHEALVIVGCRVDEMADELFA